MLLFDVFLDMGNALEIFVTHMAYPQIDAMHYALVAIEVGISRGGESTPWKVADEMAILHDGVTGSVLLEVSGRGERPVTPLVGALDQMQVVSFVLLQVPLEFVWFVETCGAQLALVRPNGMHTFLVHLQISERLAFVLAAWNVAPGLVLLHVFHQVNNEIAGEFDRIAAHEALDDARRVRLVFLQVRLETNFVSESLAAVAAREAKQCV
jgi:hypothetical protein